MKIYLSIIVLFLTCLTAKAQSNEAHLIKTEEQNLNWLKSLQENELEKQLDLIRTRILSDTATIQSTLHHGPVIEKNNKSISQCKPHFFVTYQDKDALHLSINLKKDFVLDFVDVLKPKNVKKILILNNELNKAQINALYGTQGDCGVINLILTNKRIYNYVKNLRSR